jgi:CheY-like chemotaxis protein
MMATKDSPVAILLVDDDAQICETYAELLTEEGYRVDTSSNAEEALNYVQRDKKSYQVALIDQVLAGKMDGIELMRNLRASLPKLEVILFTGWGSSSEADGLQAGAFRFLQKPIDPDVLQQLVKVCADAWQAREELDIAQRQSKIFETLQDYSQKITSSLDLDYILDQTYLCLGQIMNVENLTITLLNLHRDKLDCVRSYNEGKVEEVLPLPFSMSEGTPGLMGWIVRHKAPLLIRDLSQDIPPVRSIKWGKGEECKSFLGAPLLSQDQPVGAIAVQHPKISRYDSTDQRTLMAVANLAAQALYNARLFNELQVLDRISRRIMQPDDIRTMLESILEPIG